MDRVLKRVGLSKRTQLDNETRPTNTEDNIQIRRRRRSKSRRRTRPNSDIEKKPRGLFHIDWDVVKDCKSCKSKAITRRFCSKKSDNELYRSNSFKFERFIRNSDDLSPIKRKTFIECSRRFSNELISLCEDYSLPVDHLAELTRRRPNSIAVSNNCFLSQNFSDLILSSPEAERVVVLDNYSNPKDSNQQQLIQEEKYFTSPDKEYSQPYTTEESSSPTSDEELLGYSTEHNKANVLDLNSPQSAEETEVRNPPASVLDLVLSPGKAEAPTRRHPSPYYYGDLFKYRTESILTTDTANNKNLPTTSKSDIVAKKSKHSRKHRKAPEHESKEKTLSRQQRKSSSIDSRSTSSRDASNEPVETQKKFQRTEDGLDEMTRRQRHVYETAFDCSISKSDDDLDQIDRVTNHPAVLQWNYTDQAKSESSDKGSVSKSFKSSKTVENPASLEDNKQIGSLAKNMQNMNLASEEPTTSSLGGLVMCGYTPSPPSTAPLPSKFPGKELLMMNSIRSAPNLPSRLRTKDLTLPIKSLKGRSAASAFEIEFGHASKTISEFKGRPGNSREQTGEMARIVEIKSRPKPAGLLMVPKRTKDNMMRRHKYSSAESMTTSSSGGSMESIKSSTSEGNRSTSSSSSRQSPSLSSHSSDSGNGRPKSHSRPQPNYLGQQTVANKLHILSPISDKSSQEPISETNSANNNKNNNSEECSPECQKEPKTFEVKLATKKRLPQNKNLSGLNYQDRPEIRGSDSGISMQSREGLNKSRYALIVTNNDLSAPPSHQDLSEDLPFDMPKLRRRRLMPDSACTSGSATSIDLRELPFDMPKLRRRMRLQASNLENSVSQASSSQSVTEVNAAHTRPKLTLNLGEMGRKKMGLTLSGIGTNDGASTSYGQGNFMNYTFCDNIDIEQPLEKQGWFHGSITRIEAENVLKSLREGSFLVRNSESIKNDYSLSLKSARGFMHMRIQRTSETNGGFILGQFSQPFTSIPEMIKHFSMNRLPIRGAEHMCLLRPVIAPLL